MDSTVPRTITELVKPLLGWFNIEADITTSSGHADGSYVVAIRTSHDGQLLVGHNGEHLRALDHLIRLMALRKFGQPTVEAVDVNGYRHNQVSALQIIASQAAAEVRLTHRAQALRPMSSYERRIIHAELSAATDLITESIGQEPQRRIVIKPCARFIEIG